LGQSRILNIASDGLGVAVGKMSEKTDSHPNGLFECAFDAKFYKDITFTEPHLVRTSLGAAPAGYGLGESYCKRVNSVEDITKSGYYIVWLDRNNGEPVHGNFTFYALADASYNNVHLQCKAAGGYLHRDKWDGTWQPWEWVNPPMVLGTEYRTTERFNGKAVYAKLFDIGELPTNSYKKVAHGLTKTAVVSLYGASTNGKYHFPSSYTGDASEHSVDLYINSTDIIITTVSSWVGVYGYVVVKYTKD
jgi:hypothetical protein